MLENLGFKKKTHVGISLSANNFIELVCIDKADKSIVRYASGNVKYNNAIKEIIDYEEFREVVESLFEEAGLDPAGCSVSMAMPNVHFDIIAQDEGADTPFVIDDNIQAEIEDLYIFKRNEPSVSYVVLNGGAGQPKNIIYGAIQTKVVAKLIEIFDSLGADLERIESSHTAMLKAIQFNEKYRDLLQPEEQTLILLVTQSSCSAFNMSGNILTDYTEEPLAVKSFSPEEVYSTISKITETEVQKNGPKSLFIISETDEVNAELLSQRIEFPGEVEYINKSIDLNDDFVDPSSIGFDHEEDGTFYLTIEAVGAAAGNLDNYPVDLNFLPRERIKANVVEVFGYEVSLDRFAIVAILTALLLGALVGFIVSTLVGSQISAMDASSEDTAHEIQVFKDNIARSENAQQKDILPKLTSILENNKMTMEIYTALSTDIPESIYIKKFVTNEAGGIGISGEAKTSEAVEQFVNGLREKNGNLMISKISVNSKFDPVPSKIPDGFTFEIKTQDKEVYMQEEILPNQMQNTLNNDGSSYSEAPGSVMAPPPSPII